MEATLLGHAGVAGALDGAVPRALRPDGRPRRRVGGWRSGSSRRSTPSTRSTRTGSCAGSSASSPRCCARTTSSARAPKPYLSFKLDPHQIPLTPLPRPKFEIFVYSPRVEGVHLRGGAVARGGLRWSDRREDFRTEILGLMKAQMVKNAVIVPVGAKGGFVVKRPGDARVRRGCYTTFLVRAARPDRQHRRRRASSPPSHVVRADGDDPYLVVAADKGTATFSDIANGVASRLRLLARRRVRVRRLGRLRPQGDGHHRPRRVGERAAPLPRARHRRAGARTSPSSASAT